MKNNNILQPKLNSLSEFTSALSKSTKERQAYVDDIDEAMGPSVDNLANYNVLHVDVDAKNNLLKNLTELTTTTNCLSI